MATLREVSGASRGVAVTKSDSATLETTRALWVGGAGDVAVIFEEGTSAVTLSGVAAGTLLPVQVNKVMSTNTTATSIVAFY